MNNRCCEEMEMLVKGLKENSGGVSNTLYWNGNVLEELNVGDAPNIIFRFCPYCGKVLDGDRTSTTKGDFLKQLRQAVAISEASKMGTHLRRAAELEETIDRFQKIVDSVAALDFVE